MSGPRDVWVVRVAAGRAVADRVAWTDGAYASCGRVEAGASQIAQLFQSVRAGSSPGACDLLVIDAAAAVRLLHLPVAGPRALSRERFAEMVRWEMAPWVGSGPEGEAVCAARLLGSNGKGRAHVNGSGTNLHAWLATGAPRRRRDELRDLATASSLRLRGVVAPASAAATLAPRRGAAVVLYAEGDRVRAVRVEDGVPVGDRERAGPLGSAADLVDADAGDVVVAGMPQDAASLGVLLGRSCTSAPADVAAAVATAHSEGRLLCVPTSDPAPPLWRRPLVPALAGAALAAVVWVAGDAELAAREEHAGATRRLQDEVEHRRVSVATLRTAMEEAGRAQRFLDHDVAGRRHAVSALLAALRERCAGRARLRQVADADGGAILLAGTATDAAAAQQFHTDLGQCLTEHGWRAGPFAIRRDVAGGPYSFTARLVPVEGSAR